MNLEFFEQALCSQTLAQIPTTLNLLHTGCRFQIELMMFWISQVAGRASAIHNAMQFAMA